MCTEAGGGGATLFFSHGELWASSEQVFKGSYGIYAVALSSQCKGNSSLVAVIPQFPPLKTRADCLLTPSGFTGL